MPILARFYGMIIKMYFLGKEHGVAHIHVIYGDFSGVIEIASGQMLEGDLPTKALSMVQEWTELHKQELLSMWENQKIHSLPPLE